MGFCLLSCVIREIHCFYRNHCIYLRKLIEQEGVFMFSDAIVKYASRIRTRSGSIVENLMIHGRDEIEAQKKLRQMYPRCQIVDCICHRGGVRVPVPSFEEVASLIVR